jgi:tRNA/rRNA methyltransferase
MLNFGLTDLRIVDPCCNITSDNALALSAGASAILYNAKVYKNLSDAICDLQRVFATTVRLRYMNQLIYTPREAANEIVSLKKSEKIQSLGNNQSEDIRKNCGIVFGRERNGLNNNEVALADSIITIPTFKHFSSLNLAQAVNIVGYEMWTKKLEIESTSPPPIRLDSNLFFIILFFLLNLILGFKSSVPID